MEADKKSVAFYCRVNHRDPDYEQYLPDVKIRLAEEYGSQEWNLELYYEEASGADPNRVEFNHLKTDVGEGKIGCVVTMRAATIARNWNQFMDFMKVCEDSNVPVHCIDKVEDASAIYDRIQLFKLAYFEEGGDEA